MPLQYFQILEKLCCEMIRIIHANFWHFLYILNGPHIYVHWKDELLMNQKPIESQALP